VAKIVNLADDLALALAAPSIRIQAPVPVKRMSVSKYPIPNFLLFRCAS
jgi:DNA segregation ATPase FtsK/SpoIIIE-like protein